MMGYDREADVLYLSFGRPEKGMQYVEADNDVILRVHPRTKKIVGVTIVDFARRFSDVRSLTRLPVAGDFVMVGG